MIRARIVALYLFLICLTSIAPAGDIWVVREDGVGPVEVGMTLAQLSATLHQKLAEQDSGSDNCFYLTANGHDHLSFMIENSRLVG
jgi:hypothetical protein